MNAGLQQPCLQARASMPIEPKPPAVCFPDGVEAAALVVRKRLGALRGQQSKSWTGERARRITYLKAVLADILSLKTKGPL